ncbi:MAG: thioredoxin domain-containing protein [Candidatus ainarchaeum sp.]|nr:thioredoxin domain-containing protein [Candidatus ainarchaeum sp.]
MSVILVNRHNFEEEVIESDIPVVVDFWEKSSNQCRLLNPIFEEVSLEKEYRNKIKFVKINSEENKPISTKYNVEDVPCVVVFVKGKEIGRIPGFEPKSVLQQKLNYILRI